jgi:low affinity Fe/Cu permease
MLSARLAAAVCALVAWAISTLAILGFLSDFVRLYRWADGDVGMVVNTAIAINVLAVAVFLVANSERFWARRNGHPG